MCCKSKVLYKVNDFMSAASCKLCHLCHSRLLADVIEIPKKQHKNTLEKTTLHQGRTDHISLPHDLDLNLRP